MQKTQVKTAMAALVLGAFASPALAQGGSWVSAGAGLVDAKLDQRSGEGFTATTLLARIGYDFGRYVGVEAEGALALSGARGSGALASTVPFDQSVRTKYGGDYGVFLRGRLPVANRAEVFARIGLGGRDTEAEVFNNDENGNPLPVLQSGGSDVYGAFGIGAQLGFGTEGRNAVRLDVAWRGFADFTEEASDRNNPTDTALSLAFVRRF